jgi:hypothetical protein
VFTDTAEAGGPSEVQAEFNANARAFKRAARWPGPGQSLYQPSAITMFRGNADNELRVWSDDPKKPHIDERSEKFLLGYYDKLLVEKIIPVYGHPLDHLQALGLASATTGTAVAAGSGVVAQAEPPQHQATVLSAELERPRTPAPATAPVRQKAASSSETTAIRESARKAGYTDTVSETLMRLAREDDKSPLASAFAECVAAWLSVLGSRQVPEAKILEAVAFVLDKCSTRQGAQVRFGQWVAAKATAAAQQSNPKQAPPSSDVTPPLADPATLGAADPQLKLAAAMRELQDAIGRHYTERTATRIAGLAIGADPDGKIDLAKVPPATLRCVAELLDAAATLRWSTGKLDEEISRAHNSTQQGTSASRFGAFAIHLINSAEARVEEDARAAEAAAAPA